MKKLIIRSRMFLREDRMQQERQRIMRELNESGICIMDPYFEILPVPSEWVKLEYAAPVEYAEVLFCDKNKIQYIGTYNSFKQFVDRSGEIIDDVVAWMPAPLPYEDE